MTNTAGEAATTSFTAASSALDSATSQQADDALPAPTSVQNPKPATPPAAVQALVALGVIGKISVMALC